MQQQKRRPTLEELRVLPVELWRLEAAQIGVDAAMAEQFGIEIEACNLMDDPEITPEKIIALREKLTSGTGSAAIEAEQEVA